LKVFVSAGIRLLIYHLQSLYRRKVADITKPIGNAKRKRHKEAYLFDANNPKNHNRGKKEEQYISLQPESIVLLPAI
jgi:hypothetical protein